MLRGAWYVQKRASAQGLQRLPEKVGEQEKTRVVGGTEWVESSRYGQDRFDPDAEGSLSKENEFRFKPLLVLSLDP